MRIRRERTLEARGEGSGAVLMLLLLGAVACGSVASHGPDAGAGGAGTGGKAGVGGSIAAGGTSATGGSPATGGGTGTGGAAGTTATGGGAGGIAGIGGKIGVAGQGGGAGGQGGALPQPRFSGHITTTASYHAAGTTMKLAAQSLTTELGRSCGVTTCVSGGISP